MNIDFGTDMRIEMQHSDAVYCASLWQYQLMVCFETFSIDYIYIEPIADSTAVLVSHLLLFVVRELQLHHPLDPADMIVPTREGPRGVLGGVRWPGTISTRTA